MERNFLFTRCHVFAIDPVLLLKTAKPGRFLAMKSIRLRVVAICGVGLAAALFCAAPAQAGAVSFSGTGNSGIDPLGNTWLLTPDFDAVWGEPGFAKGLIQFNGNGSSSGSADFATSFTFTLQPGVATSISNSIFTRFRDTSTSTDWEQVIAPDGSSVTFTAPAGTQLSNGDEFFVNVNFTSPISGPQFAFTAGWDVGGGTSVPEPASMALLGAGVLGLVGATRARRR